MKTNTEIFTNALLKDFESSKFLRLLSSGTELGYFEAAARTYHDDLISDRLNAYAFGHMRYFLLQTRFRDSAISAGLEVQDRECPKNNYPITIVHAGRFSFTLHYGKTANDITCPQTSLMRTQSAVINSRIVQESLYEKLNFDENKLEDASHIYANIIHGCNGNGLNFTDNGFMRIAVPCLKKMSNGKTSFMFVANVNLHDILKGLVARESVTDQATPMVTALPTVKKSARS